MIYYAQINDYWIKIGTTSVWQRRHKQLESSQKKPVILLGVHAGHQYMERCMHCRFRHLRLRRTEWFHPGPDLLEHIKHETHAWTEKDDTDEEWDTEVMVTFSGEYLQWMRQLGRHNGTSLCRTLNEAMWTLAQSTGFQDEGYTLRERRPHDLFNYQPPKFDLPDEEDDEEEDATVDTGSAVENEGGQANPVAREFFIEGAWG